MSQPLRSLDSLDKPGVAFTLPPTRALPLLLLSLGALAYCIWILSLPLFPTQDGPIHLLFARIMQALLLHQDPGIFPQYYTVKHVLPPYALYYYLLVLFSHFGTLVTADKLVICLYAVLFLFGFRYLARVIGPAGDVMALLALPLVLNWPLGMGFVNFCLSGALALWALGLWCRVAVQPANQRNRLRLAGFVVLCFAAMLTHPVPLLAALGFCLLELLVRLIRRRAWDARSRALMVRTGAIRPIMRDAIALVLASTTVLYIKAFTTNNVFRQVDAAQETYFTKISGNIRGLILLHTLTAFSGKSVLDVLYRGSIILVLAVPLGLAVREFYRSVQARRWSLGNTWLVVCVLLIFAVPIIPPDLNNSHFFSERLVIYIWIAALAAASGSHLPMLRSRISFESAMMLFAVAATAVTLLLAARRIDPVAQQVALVESLPLTQDHEVGLMLHSVDYDSPHTLTYDPYYWSGARLFRRSSSVLYNTPWLDLAIIPLGPKEIMPTGNIDMVSLEWAIAMRETLVGSAAARSLVFDHVDFALINHGTTAFNASPDPVLSTDPVAAHRWRCVIENVYTICGVNGAAPPLLAQPGSGSGTAAK